MLRQPLILFLALIVASVASSACGAGGEPAPSRDSGDAASPREPSDATMERRGGKADRPAGTPRVVFLGDSLTAGLGLPETESYPALIQARLDREGYGYEVVNAGVSGDTSAGGLRRLDWALEGNVQLLVIALGANDGLRGLPTDELGRNLSTIVEKATARGVTVVLAGMEAPPNNGPDYAAAFRATYRDLARKHDVPLIPFLLQGVAGERALNQADGIHPNARGARLIADLVWRTIHPALSEHTAEPGESNGPALSERTAKPSESSFDSAQDDPEPVEGSKGQSNGSAK